MTEETQDNEDNRLLIHPSRNSANHHYGTLSPVNEMSSEHGEQPPHGRGEQQQQQQRQENHDANHDDDNDDDDTTTTNGTPSRRRHERNGSLVENFFDEIQDVAEAFVEEMTHITDVIVEEMTEVTEAVREEMHDVADAFVEEFQEHDKGDAFMFEMTLTRGMSMLPTDIMEFAEATTDHNTDDTDTEPTQGTSSVDEEHQPLKKDHLDTAETTQTTAEWTPISAYLLLISAVFALSSIGPLLNVQVGVDSVMKVYWRMSATAMFLFPFAVHSYRKEGMNQLNKTQMMNLLFAAASYAFMCGSFVVALNYTAVGNAVIFSNSQSLILLLSKFLVGDPVLLMEAAGAVVAFSGAALCSRDSMTSAPSGSNMTLYGDFLAMLSAVGGVWYLIFAKIVRPHVSLYIFMFLIMSIGSTLLLVFMWAMDMKFSFDRNIEHGIWGWMNIRSDRLPLELTMVILCNIIGAMGYIRAMRYFDNLVISVAALLEPIVAELTAFALGVGYLPGLLGWIGNVMVLCGTFAVVLPTVKSGSNAH